MITLSTSRPETKPERRLQLDATFVEQLFVALTLIGIVVGVLLERAGAAPGLLLTVRMATYFVGGFFAVIAIIEALRERTIEVDLLMVLAALGAAYVDAWTEGAILLFLFSLSNVLQNYAMNRTRSAISSLLELRPDTVTVRRNGAIEQVPLEAIAVGDLVVLRPGDRVPLDGVIMQGTGNFDESALTGESMPVQKGVGSTILAGTLNQSGAIDMQVAKTA
ncbi:MAG: heavy metal translocating P-type ATPase, partial [Chloroflexia bacterium]|nr:heavy metal translocating P-type ATPase [Chloroflexia bacterium]